VPFSEKEEEVKIDMVQNMDKYSSYICNFHKYFNVFLSCSFSTISMITLMNQYYLRNWKSYVEKRIAKNVVPHYPLRRDQ